MLKIKEIIVEGYKKVIEATDSRTNLTCFIAIHSTLLGPSLGGTRIHPYPSKEDALQDVLMLGKAMTYKSAIYQLGIGGGKSVLIADPDKQKNEPLLLSFAEVVHTLQGDYIAAEDMGSTPSDMMVIRKKTPFVAALPTQSSSGDPSRFTAWGIFRGIQAVAKKLWGSPKVSKKKILIQGLGQVGSKLANILFWEGADLILSESNSRLLHEYAALFGAQTIDIDEYASQECDIFVPCALGGVLTEENIPKLPCQAIAGGANNQLASVKAGEMLMARGILYAPDYVINAGGLINAALEFNQGGYCALKSREKVNEIYNILLDIFEKSEKGREPPEKVADRLAEYNLAHLIGKRKTPIEFAEHGCS